MQPGRDAHGAPPGNTPTLFDAFGDSVSCELGFGAQRRPAAAATDDTFVDGCRDARFVAPR